MKNSEENKVMNTAKEAYVKPAMEVYEMEMDAAVLVDTPSGLPGTPFGKAEGIENPFAGIEENLKA